MKFQAGVFDQNNKAIAMQLDYIPLWLAKISITPNMKENNPELVDKLIKYQLKAKDVLAAAFLPEKYTQSNTVSNENAGRNVNDEKKQAKEQLPDMPNTLDFHDEPVMTTDEMARYYNVPYQNLLGMFYKNKDYFKSGVHYFLLDANHEIEFRKMNGLNISTKIYIWTMKGFLMFLKTVNNETGWNYYTDMLGWLFQKTYEGMVNKRKEEKEPTHNSQTCNLPACKQAVTVKEDSYQLKLQSNWYTKNTYKIERTCNALNMDTKDFAHIVLMRIQEKYDMRSINDLYKNKNGKAPRYALDIIDCFKELEEIADSVLNEFIFSIIDRFALAKNMSVIK